MTEELENMLLVAEQVQTGVVTWFTWMALGLVDIVAQTGYLEKVDTALSQHKDAVAVAAAGMVAAQEVKQVQMVPEVAARRFYGQIK